MGPLSPFSARLTCFEKPGRHTSQYKWMVHKKSSCELGTRNTMSYTYDLLNTHKKEVIAQWRLECMFNMKRNNARTSKTCAEFVLSSIFFDFCEDMGWKNHDKPWC
jgi:hypothetical protein